MAIELVKLEQQELLYRRPFYIYKVTNPIDKDIYFRWLTCFFRNEGNFPDYNSLNLADDDPNRTLCLDHGTSFIPASGSTEITVSSTASSVRIGDRLRLLYAYQITLQEGVFPGTATAGIDFYAANAASISDEDFISQDELLLAWNDPEAIEALKEHETWDTFFKGQVAFACADIRNRIGRLYSFYDIDYEFSLRGNHRSVWLIERVANAVLCRVLQKDSLGEASAEFLREKEEREEEMLTGAISDKIELPLRRRKTDDTAPVFVYKDVLGDADTSV